MNYYKRNIGDYAAATRHLNIVEHGAYMLLLDFYYTHECALPAEVREVCRRIGARSKDEQVAVETVLKDFFLLNADGWRQNRCDKEIELYQSKAETNRVTGRLGGRPKKRTQPVDSGNPEITQTVSEINPHETLTSNQEPVTSNQEPIPDALPPVQPPAEPEGPARVSKTGAICIVLKSEGIASVNPSHPDLAALIAAGAEVGQFAAAARAATAKGKGFAYALGIVKSQMLDAAAMAATALSPPLARAQSPPVESFRERDDRTARERWEQMTGETHPGNMRQRVVNATVNAPAKRLEINP